MTETQECVFSLSLSQVYISSRFFRSCFLFVFLLVRTCGKTPSTACSIVFTLFTPPTPHPPTPDFRIRPFPYDTSVLCVHDQGECFRLHVGTGNHPATASSGPLSKASAASERSDSSQPNRLFEAGGAASFPPPLPSSAWLPSSAINHPKLINTNKAAS